MKTGVILNPESTKSVMLQVRLLANETVQDIIKYIRSKKETNVSSIYGDLNLVQSITSMLLGKMRSFGMVSTRREGKQIFYSIEEDYFTKVNELIEEWIK